MAEHWVNLATDIETLEAQLVKEPANSNEPYRSGSRIAAQQSRTAEREEEAAQTGTATETLRSLIMKAAFAIFVRLPPLGVTIGWAFGDFSRASDVSDKE